MTTCMTVLLSRQVFIITFLLCRQLNAVGKDASEDDIEKIELECVRDFHSL